MAVREMIDRLGRYPGDMRAVVNGYEAGCDDLSPSQSSVMRVALNTGAYAWEGQHGEPGDAPADASGPAKIVDALVLHRSSN